MRQFLKFVLAAGLLILVVGLIIWKTYQAPPPEDGPVSGWTEMTSSRFRIRYKMPPHWKASAPGETDAWSGWNGFVQVSGIGGPEITLEDALRLEVSTGVNPYGADAVVKRLTVGGQAAILVLPSDDQPRTDDRAVLLVEYPADVTFRGERYQHLIFWADRPHIDMILETITFVGGEEEVRGTLTGQAAIDSNLADIFENRKVLVYAADGTTLLHTLDISQDGRFTAELDPGAYVIDINRVGLDKAVDFPREITIEPGKTTRVDIVIQTGI